MQGFIVRKRVMWVIVYITVFFISLSLKLDIHLRLQPYILLSIKT